MKDATVWFVTGSQHLYGPEALNQVAEHARIIVEALNSSADMPQPVVWKPTVTGPEEASKIAIEANSDPHCAGVILWMHTFSPAKMWIGGLKRLAKPVCHLHTQFNESLPWSTIDMDFMNLNQAAHGDREAAHLHGRIGLNRKIIVGHWSHSSVQARIGRWVRVACAWCSWQTTKIARFGDNMRSVSVTEGDKVSAEAQFGFSVNGYGMGDLVTHVLDVAEQRVDDLISEYAELYEVSEELLPGGNRYSSLRDAARQELGIRDFLSQGGFSGFTTTFEDLHGLDQLPGLACQRLMADGYGFGAEGDWKTAALLRAFKVMEQGLPGGTSFMEDYTYHLEPGNELVLGAHMLEICPSIAASKPKMMIHPLAIGGKSDPVRLVFDARPGFATNTSLIDLGHRFRFVVNDVESVEVPDMPKLPVARAVWRVEPDFESGVAAWLFAGGAHHTVYSMNVDSEQVRDFADMAGVECLVIDQSTSLSAFRNEIRWNQGAFVNRG